LAWALSAFTTVVTAVVVTADVAVLPASLLFPVCRVCSAVPGAVPVNAAAEEDEVEVVVAAVPGAGSVLLCTAPACSWGWLLGRFSCISSAFAADTRNCAYATSERRYDRDMFGFRFFTWWEQ
jgi:hypothetical protein